MLILAIDPAKAPEDRGFALWNNGECISYGRTPPHRAVDLCMVEAQWANPEANRKGLITLANYAGFLAGRTQADRYVAIPPTEWKRRVIPGAERLPKEQYTALLRRKWPSVTPKGKRKKHGKLQDAAADVLDAMGIGASYWQGGGYTLEQMQEWELVT